MYGFDSTPRSLKDVVETKGIRTTDGSTLFRDHVPVDDDIVPSGLKAAGAIIVGMTNSPEFGYGGITDNVLRGPIANLNAP